MLSDTDKQHVPFKTHFHQSTNYRSLHIYRETVEIEMNRNPDQLKLIQ